MIRNFVSRRDLIRIFASLGASAALFPGFAGIKTTSGKPARKAAINVTHDFSDLISNQASAAEIGNAYLSQSESAMDPESIANSIFDTGGGPYATLGETRAALCDQIRNDFTHGRTVLVCGWVLSQTEASVCALVAVTSAS